MTGPKDAGARAGRVLPMPAPRFWRKNQPDPSVRRRVSTGQPTVAVITMARDEADMLPRWVRHYGAQVGESSLLVFDDNSTDGSTDDLPCTVHRLPQLPGRRGYEDSRMELMSGIAQGLLAAYEFVIFADVDELIIPDPDRYDGLLDFLAARRDRSVLAPVALNVVHHPGVEGAIDPSQPVLGQRRFAKFVPLMCKPAVKSVPAAWCNASHGIMAPFEVDPDLFMFHLKFYDREALRAVADRRHEMVQADGRARKSSWSVSGDEMAAMLDRFVAGADPDKVPEFDPRKADLAAVVHKEEGDVWRTMREGQVRAMETRRLWRVPDRLLGRL